MKKFLVIGTLLALSTQAYAIRESNGGKGVVVGSEIVVFDLYKAGITEPYFGHDKSSFGVRAGLWRLPSELPKEQIARKLEDIGVVSQKINSKIFGALNSVTWSFTDETLPPTQDRCMTETGLTTVQVARRTGNNVLINRPLWDKMSEEQQAAFVVHEVVYFAVDPRSIQFNACKVNDFVAMIYTEEGLEKATLQRPTWLAMFGIFQAH